MSNRERVYPPRTRPTQDTAAPLPIYRRRFRFFPCLSHNMPPQSARNYTLPPRLPPRLRQIRFFRGNARICRPIFPFAVPRSNIPDAFSGRPKYPHRRARNRDFFEALQGLYMPQPPAPSMPPRDTWQAFHSQHSRQGIPLRKRS